WVLLDSLADLAHLGAGLQPEFQPGARISWRELDGAGELRFLVSANDWNTLTTEILRGASKRLGQPMSHLRELDDNTYHAIAPEEQYLVATGRTYFRDLSFDQLHRLQFDLETTGLNADRDRIFMIAVRDNAGVVELLEARGEGKAAEATLIRELVARVQAADPD